MQRIERYGSFQAGPISDGGSSQRLQALADLGKSVGNIAFQYGVKKRTAEGEAAGFKAGAKAAETGAEPEQKTGIIPTVYGEAFNNAQQGAYVASVDRKAVERISEIEQEYSHDLEGFAKISESMLGGLLEGMPESYKPILSESISGYISRGKMRVNQNIIKRGEEEAKSELTGAIDTYWREASRSARNGDSDAMQENLAKVKDAGNALVAGKFWTKEQAEEAYRSARNETTEQIYLEIADTLPFSEAAKAIDDAEKNVFPGFSGDEHDALIARARGRLQKRITESSRDSAKQNSIYRDMDTELRTAIKTGEGDPDKLIEQLNFLYKKEVYKPAQYASLFGEIYNDLRHKQRVWDRVDTGDKTIVVEPSAVNKVYAKEYVQASPDQKVGFAASVNMIPEQMKKEISNSLYSGDINQAADAANMMESLADIPGMPDSFPIKDQAYASQIVNLMSVFPEEEAIKMARQNTDPRDQARIEFRVEEVKQKFDANYWQEGANSALASIFSSVDPVVMPMVAKDFETAFTSYYVAGMEKDDAKDAAKKQLKRVYSNWNGRPMKHAPDKYYAVDGKTDWIDIDLKTTLNEEIFGSPEIKDYYLISDVTTAKQASVGSPTYLVRYRTQDGWNTLMGRYFPDKEGQIKKQKDINKSEVQKLRRESTRTAYNIPNFENIP